MTYGTGGTAAAVVPLLERSWPSVLALAGRLFKDNEVRNDDVLAALGLNKATAAHGLALIRAGAAPGTFTVTPPRCN